MKWSEATPSLPIPILCQIGEAFQRAFRKGVVKRKEIFVTAKVWGADHGNVEAAIKTSLKKLQVRVLITLSLPANSNLISSI
jgi:diketogulonate reductase-like aldo/keto reductase